MRSITMKLKRDGLFNLLIGSAGLMAFAASAAPVPVTGIITTPGFGPETFETNGQALVYIETATDAYVVTGATCTYCPSGIASSPITEAPASQVEALSGLKYTQAVLNFGAVGAKFDFGVTLMDDSVGIVLGEIGTTSQTAGDPINVYPTVSGVRVGTWMRAIVPSDYGSNGKYWDKRFPNTQQYFQGFLTTFRCSDFTNGTGLLSFDGIEISGNTGYDPNIVAIIGDPIPVATHKLPVTAMTFSPGFDTNPELDGQILKSLTTEEGTFQNISGLICVSSAGGAFGAANEGVPSTITNALSGLKFTQGSVNPGNVDWILDAPVVEADTDVRFFFGEISRVGFVNPPDAVTIVPLFNGAPISDRNLVISSGDYGTPSPVWKSTYSGYEFEAPLVSFSLADFRTTPFQNPDISVTGFRVSCGGAADPIVFGMYRISLKGTIIMIN